MSTVERDLSLYERQIDAQDRLDQARDHAIAAERERLDALTVAELIADQAPLITRLRDVSDSCSRTPVILDLDSIIQVIASSNVDADAERSRSEK